MGMWLSSSICWAPPRYRARQRSARWSMACGAYAINLDKYEILTMANCQSFTVSGSLLRFPDIAAVVDQPGFRDIVRLAWVDVINAGVWLLIVLVLEVDVRLQNRKILAGSVLRVSRTCKFFLYSTLLLRGPLYWGLKGDFVYFWDAFLWLVAFIFIELNVFTWLQE